MSGASSDLPVYVSAIQENVSANESAITGAAAARAIDWTRPVPGDLANQADTVRWEYYF